MFKSLVAKHGIVQPAGAIYPSAVRTGVDLGPLGALLRRNIAGLWWRELDRFNEISAVDPSILTPHDVLTASGHVQHFADETMRDLLSGERIRKDHRVPLIAENDVIPIKARSHEQAVEWQNAALKRYPTLQTTVRNCELLVFADVGQTIRFPGGEIANDGCAHNNSPFLEQSATQPLLFETQCRQSTVYLRPETAQGVYCMLPLLKRTHGLRVPFGLAAEGRVFRNELHAKGMFRMREFEQMELQYFVHPNESPAQHATWVERRLAWWRRYARNPGDFRARKHTPDELAHYAAACTDIEYRFPDGWKEVEGVANRGAFDLDAHARASGQSFEFRDANNRAFVPHIIESSAGLSRAVLAFLHDSVDAIGFCLHPALAPHQVEVYAARDSLAHLSLALRESGVRSVYSMHGSRYSQMKTRSDEIGVLCCVYCTTNGVYLRSRGGDGRRFDGDVVETLSKLFNQCLRADYEQAMAILGRLSTLQCLR